MRTALAASVAVAVVGVLSSAGAADAASANATAAAGTTSHAVTRAVAATTTPGIVGTLSAQETSVQQGQSITFDYSVPASDVLSNNWVGLYSDPGDGPVNQVYVGASTT